MENKVFILDQTTIKKLLTIYKLVIPDFQRNFVWKQAKKQQLLESLFRGFPIGAITLYEDDNNKGYYIIDGLQRINTLNQYLSRPATVIPFNRFCVKIEEDIQFFIEEYELTISFSQLKKYIKKWYEKLSSLYEFEKVSVLFNVFSNEKDSIAKQFCDLEIVEALLDVLKSKIEIVHDDIALIIYKGDKNELPDLFKNINTGSVALSQYEILQSVWNEYLLDKEVLRDTYEAFNRELDSIRDDYEIDAIKEAGQFDIFKNIVGLNHIICSNEKVNLVFRFSSFKKLVKPIEYSDNYVKFYENDSIAFELYSTILCGSSNQIVKAIDLIYNNTNDKNKISQFVNLLNKAIIKSIDIAILELDNRTSKMIESKYHSLYVLVGIILSNYEIDVRKLSIEENKKSKKMFDEVLKIEQHIKNKWFVDENRQMGFFNIKIGELVDIKSRERMINEENDETSSNTTKEKMAIRINGEIICASTVKEFYSKIFLYLIENNINFDNIVPYATGNKRYLINWKNEHVNGNIFISPLVVKNYYIETHKSKNGAIQDVYKFLKEINVNVEYAK